MSRFERARDVVWKCQRHFGWDSEKALPVSHGPIFLGLQWCLLKFCQSLGSELWEMTVGVPPSGGQKQIHVLRTRIL